MRQIKRFGEGVPNPCRPQPGGIPAPEHGSRHRPPPPPVRRPAAHPGPGTPAPLLNCAEGARRRRTRGEPRSPDPMREKGAPQAKPRVAERTLGKKSPVSQPAPRDPADTYG
ncbi:hypothetical protein GCM10009576_034260 [Streptomyces rhizosphaericus]|uniref:Uncharacterized protein n=2 Tax=Streptomyces rhizosphaericus TaxID=114699 RepID=A0ABN1Q1J4_9ACTN